MKNEKVVQLYSIPPDSDQLIVTLNVGQLRQLIHDELAATKANATQTTADHLLNANQAAKVLQVSSRWLYKHANELPYAVRLSETLVRFSQNKIQEEIERKLKMQGK